MLKIRLQRVGRVHEPTFRVVVTDSQNGTKSGKYVEVVGSHDPRHKDKTALNVERIKHWISVGAQPTITMHNMLISKKIIEGKKRNALPKKTVQKPAPAEGETAPAASTPAPEAKKEKAPAA